MQPSVLIAILFHLTGAAAVSSIFKYCSLEEQHYIEGQVDQTMRVFQWIVDARATKETRTENNIDYFEKKYFGELNQEEQDLVSARFKRALQDPPTLVF